MMGAKRIHRQTRMKYWFVFYFLFCSILFAATLFADDQYPIKKVLIVAEGTSDIKNIAMGDARQLADLMGHFSTSVTLKGVHDYRLGELNNYDFIFYVGFNLHNEVPAKFLVDVMTAQKRVIWLNTGMIEFCRRYDVKKRYGFTVSEIDSTSMFNQVRANNHLFTKGEPKLHLIHITNPAAVSVSGTVYSTSRGKSSPYIVTSGNLTYIADSPFAFAIPGDHYIYFADLLHDILGEQHEESHSAMIRIEDISVFDNPDKLREIADVFSRHGIPFMVGVIPFFVDPGEGIHLSLSDKPDLVDALQYMVRNGGTIVMHGITHQYKGTTATDFEFWDDNTNSTIQGETEEADAHKIELGIQEFMKNGLYPLVWETPHYTASFKLYRTISKYFSTACEQRLSIEDADFSQFFPYIIKKDLFGQTIYPENLGYVPLNPDKDESRKSVQQLIDNAKAEMYVRDGVSTAFFHSFLDIELLEQLIDGIQNLGYTFMDMREQTNWVRTKDRIILSGSQQYTMNLKDQYLMEAYYDENGELKQRMLSEKRLLGPVTKKITLAPGEFYRAEATEFREKPETFFQKIASQVQRLFENFTEKENSWQPVRPLLMWNYFARGAFFHDQSSFASVFQSVNVRLDTAFLGQPLSLANYNLLIIPAAIADSLNPAAIEEVRKFVKDGGNLILDAKTDLAGEFGITYASSRMDVRHIRDELFPEEPIAWRNAELVTKFDVDDIDKVFCYDEATDAPMVIGKKIEKGKILYINSLFDPMTDQGYSHYPFLLEYIRRYFSLRPFVRREQVEMYFDPGLRHTYSVENLVRSWVNNGIRIIHVAGWHQYPTYTYDYARLIRLAHANGILVYVWLEPPQVNHKFWINHPEWREKNIKGDDAKASWRFPIALTDTGCVRAVMQEFRSILETYDWDGVNLAELYFEAGRGFEDPLLFTPAHPSAKNDLKRRYGITLASVFDSLSPSYWKRNPGVREDITEYRVQSLTKVYESFLSLFQEYEIRKPGFQVVVTAMDSYNSPNLREQLGVDMQSVLALQHRFGFMLQIEDPQSLWSTDPQRYAKIGAQYQALVSDPAKLMLDLNILSFRNKDEVLPFPTLIQTGTESYHLIHSAASGAVRTTIYSEATVNPQDLAFFSNALASASRYRLKGNEIDFSSPYSTTLRLPAAIPEISLDGATVLPSRDNRYFMPAGSHQIILQAQEAGTFSANKLQPRVMSSTGNITTLEYGSRDIMFSYECSERMLIALSNLPTAITVDDLFYPCHPMQGNDCFSIFLPQGRHNAVITTGDAFSYGISITSFWSSTAIALFAVTAVSLLALMYGILKILKRRASAS